MESSSSFPLWLCPNSPTTMMLNSNPVFMALILSWSSTASMPTEPNISQGGVLGLEGRDEQGEGDCLSSMVPVAGELLERNVVC